MSEEVTAAPKPESITLNDIQSMIQIIDLASSRGAFRGPELSEVGKVFDKVNNFLLSIAAAQNTDTNDHHQTDNSQEQVNE